MTLVGASTGGLMTRPTPDQLAAARAGQRMTIAGAHTVGAPDGGAGLVGTGWSIDHGDLRVAHFVGLHAMQVLPFIALLLARLEFMSRVRTRLVVIAVASYAALFVILLIQALRGVSVVAPDAATVAQLVAWAMATAIAVAVVTSRTQQVRDTVAV